MAVYTEAFGVKTKGGVEAIDITREVAVAVQRSGLRTGIGVVFSPSSTSAVIANESDANVDADVSDLLERVAPQAHRYRHEEKWHDGNGHSHVRASLLGQSFTFPFDGSRPQLGTWQQVWFLELDNKPRSREIIVKLIGE